MAMTAHQQYQFAMLGLVAEHAIAHRRLCSRIVGDIIKRMTWAKAKGTTPYLTHCHLAKCRGRQHRNTSRYILGELAKVGLFRVWSYRKGLGIRFIANWGAVHRYAQAHQLKSLKPWRDDDTPARTAADWERERAAHAAARAAREAAQAEASAKAAREHAASQRAAIAAMSPVERLELALRTLGPGMSLHGRSKLEHQLKELRGGNA